MFIKEAASSPTFLLHVGLQQENFLEVANVALGSSHRVPELMDAYNKFVLVSWFDNAMREGFQFVPEEFYVFGFQMNFCL